MFLYTTAYADDDVILVKETQELPKQETASSLTSMLTNIAPMVLIFLVFYFFLIRPQEKRRKEKNLLLSNVKKGEEIITTTGIFGKIVKINEEDSTIDLEIAENVKIKMLKTSIMDIKSVAQKPTPAQQKPKKKGTI